MAETKSKKTKSSARIFLFCGEDDYTTAGKISAWVEAFAKKYSRHGIVTLDFGEKIGDVEAVLRNSIGSGGLFSRQRLLVIKSLFQQKAETMQGVAEILDELPEDIYMVFWENGAVKKTLKLYKKLAALEKDDRAKIYEFHTPGGADFNRFVTGYVSRNGGSILPAAMEALALALGRDLAERVKSSDGYQLRQVYTLWQVTGELDKLLRYRQGNEIRPEDVRALSHTKASENIFLLSNALGRQDVKTASRLLGQLMNEGGGDNKAKSIMIVGALAGQFRTLLQLSAAKESAGSAAAIAQVLGWTSWRVQANMPLLAHFSEKELRQLLRELLEIDKKLKSSTLPPKLLFTRLFESVKK